MCLQVYSKSGASHFLLTSKTAVNLGGKQFSVSVKKCSAGVSVLHSVCVQVSKTPGDIFHTSKQRYLIWITVGLGRAAGKDTPLFINGLSDQDVLQKEWSGARECVWVDWWGVESPSPVSRAEQRLGAHISLRWPLLSLEIFQLGVKVFFFLRMCFSFTVCCLLVHWDHTVGNVWPLWITAVARMPMSHSL